MLEVLVKIKNQVSCI